MSENEKNSEETKIIKLDSLEAVDPELNVDLTITSAEAAGRLDYVKLAEAASNKEFAQQLLAGVKQAQADKQSAENILSAITGVLGKVIDIAV